MKSSSEKGIEEHTLCPNCHFPLEPKWESCPWCRIMATQKDPEYDLDFSTLAWLWIEVGFFLLGWLPMALFGLHSQGASGPTLFLAIPIASVPAYVLYRLTRHYLA